jgi:hypothetical protein
MENTVKYWDRRGKSDERYGLMNELHHLEINLLFLQEHGYMNSNLTRTDTTRTTLNTVEALKSELKSVEMRLIETIQNMSVS